MREQTPESLDVARDHYDEWNAAWRNADFDDIEPEIRRRGAWVLEELKRRGDRHGEILEIGCGTGWLSRPLADFGPVTAIDLSPKAIDIARERGVPGTLIAGDFLAQDFAPESFDVAVLVETLFYVQDQPATMERTAEILRPGGLALLTCVNPFVYERRSDIGPPKPGQPRRWLTQTQMRDLLEPWFAVESMGTIDPQGDQGILRWANAPKVEALLGRILGTQRWRELRESWGWGAAIVVAARKRG